MTTEMAGYLAALLVLPDFLHEDDGSAACGRNLQQLHFHRIRVSRRPVSRLDPPFDSIAVERLATSRNAAANKAGAHGHPGDLNMDWLKPFTSTRRTKSGDVLFRKGDTADAMFFVVAGRYRLAELGMDVMQGQLVGELGLLAPDQSRTQTLGCIEGGEVLQITYEQVKQLYYQNPQFGFYFIQLTSRRLFENIARLEGELAACKAVNTSSHGGEASLSPE
jgi:Cyclic nucleotide-binding domain